MSALVRRILLRYRPVAGVAMFCLISASAMALTGSASRPQLTASEAEDYTVAKYLAQAGLIGALTTDPWDPTGGVALLTADYTVAADGSADYLTVQSAVDAAVAAGGTVRRYISVKPGYYTELVCVPKTAPPITLFGLGADIRDTMIRFDNANLTPKPIGKLSHPCASNASSGTVGTSGSATVTVQAQDFQASNIAFANTYVEGTYSGINQSAVALAVRADKAHFEKVVVIGNQDTLLVSANNSEKVIRAYFKNSLIEGDIDFIFGSGVAVFADSIIRYTATRLGSNRGGYIFAPSTNPRNRYGFLVINSKFDVVDAAATDATYLGRAWDQGVAGLDSYANDVSPNGQVTIRDSMLGSHIRKIAPWNDATSGRPYCSAHCTYSENRFYEYNNSDLVSAN